MNAQTLLLKQLAGARGILAETMADVRPEDMHRTVPGATIGSIGSIYTHLIHGEDALLHAIVLGQPPVWVSGGFAERTGIQPNQPGHPDPSLYDRLAGLDAAVIQAYAEATFAATDTYLSQASDAEMDRVVETGFMGPMPVGAIMANLIVWHAVHHAGEIAALKGVFGQKGLPF